MAKKVLVVDDDPRQVSDIRFLLESEGYSILTANDGSAGYDMALSEKPDLVILDLIMPITDGFETVKKFGENSMTAHIPIIAITAIRSKKNVSFKLEPDVDWFPVEAVLDKPFKDDVFLDVVKKYMG
ncbi:MAG: response regulator [Candidatus Omnitrophica bacterium]|nr:response regulator [Candidatus Omnitrophota bacterium]MDD5440925.1 response regulator [Candidatus Omnitrophota bacterium]